MRSREQRDLLKKVYEIRDDLNEIECHPEYTKEVIQQVIQKLDSLCDVVLDMLSEFPLEKEDF